MSSLDLQGVHKNHNVMFKESFTKEARLASIYSLKDLTSRTHTPLHTDIYGTQRVENQIKKFGN